MWIRWLSLALFFVSFTWMSSGSAEVCWKSTYGRGAGTIPTECGKFDKNGLLCYPHCDAGYSGEAFVCWQDCPSGFRNDGAFCAKPKPYGRGTGYAIWSKDKCKKENKETGCEKCLAMYYPKCKAGYKPAGCNICSPICPNGMTDIGVSCTKKTYTRKTILPKCGSDEYQAGLCYKSCKPDYKGVGPVCWEKCPTGMVDCGAMCGTSEDECVDSISEMVLSVAETIAKVSALIGTGGASEAAEIAESSAAAAIKEAAKETAKIAAKAAAKTAAKSVKAAITDSLKEKDISQAMKDNLGEMMSSPDSFDYESFLTSLDPTGISKVVEAFNKKICEKK